MAKTIAELVDDLFRTHRRPDGREYTYEEIARMTNGQLDPSYLGRLRKGKIQNPGRNALLLLCQVFEVPSAYFFPELGESPELSEEEIDAILAQRTAALTPEVRQVLARLLSFLKK